jgi:hypothetical protein
VITSPNKQTLLALAALDGNTDFTTVLDWMKSDLNRLYVDGSYAKDEAQARWHQGAQQWLSEFIDKAANARDTVRNSRS